MICGRDGMHVESHKVCGGEFWTSPQCSKNKMVVIGEDKESQLSIDGIPLENTDSFIYPGVHICINGNSD